jgi:hypothetical protein
MNPMKKGIAALLSGLTIAGCETATEYEMDSERRYDVEASEESRPGLANVRHAAAGLDPFGAPVGYVAGSRAAEESSAIEALLPLYPDSSRAALLTVLNSESSGFVSFGDPESAHLVRQIYEIRQHDASAAARAESRERAREHGTTLGIILSSAVEQGAPIIMHRRRGSRPANVVVLRAEDATADHLATAIAVLMKSRREYGDDAPADQTIRITSLSALPERYANLYSQAERILSRVRLAPVRSTRYGSGHTITIRLPPVVDGRAGQ